MSEIEKRLLAATKIKPQGKSEDRQKYLSRLVGAVQKLSDDAWEDLESTAGAQEWANAAVDAEEKKKPIGDFSDSESDADVDDADDTDDADDDSEEAAAAEGKGGGKKAKAVAAPSKKEKQAAAAKTGKKAADAKPEAPKSGGKGAKGGESKSAAAPAGAKKGMSMRRQLKMIIVKKPKTPVDDLIAALEKKGYVSPSKMTVASIRADTRDTLKVLNEAQLIEVEL